MEIPILVEPNAGGFRASTGEPYNFSAEGTTADAARVAVQ